ncbi:MAG: hypothetical protein QME92_04175 [Bacillota bacterium]|nr:hypothetical protein [Bacillota bacterium]
MKAGRQSYQALKSGDIFNMADTSLEQQRAYIDLYRMNARLGREERQEAFKAYNDTISQDGDIHDVIKAAADVIDADCYVYACDQDYDSLNEFLEITEREREDAQEMENPKRLGLLFESEERETSNLVLDPVQAMLVTIDLLGATRINPALLGGDVQ